MLIYLVLLDALLSLLFKAGQTFLVVVRIEKEALEEAKQQGYQ